ncbi:MAG: hypothetical protein JXN65_10110 [Clostridia bacterium]|nr:hypothetical protein [Clostridia bacterium]
METLKKEMSDRLKSLQEEFATKHIELKEDSRDDEARIEKIKGNIAGLYNDVLNVSYNQAKAHKGTDEERLQKMVDIYKGFFTKIPAAWEESLQEAKDAGDFEKIYIETEKLKISGKIKDIFDKLAEGNYDR